MAYIFKHPNKLLEHTDGLLLFDLLEQASYICSDDITVALEPPPRGLYIKGHITPLLNDRDIYYPKSRDGDPEAVITEFSTVLTNKEDIVDHRGDIVVTARNLTIVHS